MDTIIGVTVTVSPTFVSGACTTLIKNKVVLGHTNYIKGHNGVPIGEKTVKENKRTLEGRQVSNDEI